MVWGICIDFKCCCSDSVNLHLVTNRSVSCTAQSGCFFVPWKLGRTKTAMLRCCHFKNSSCPRMWRCVVGWVFRGFGRSWCLNMQLSYSSIGNWSGRPKPEGEARTISIFTVFNRKSCTCKHFYLLGLLDTWQYRSSKRPELLVQPHNITYMRTWVLCRTAEKAWNIVGTIDVKSKMDLPVALNAFDEQVRTLTLRFKMC